MAEVVGLSKATISRIRQTFGLQSHRRETFKLWPIRYHVHFTPTSASWLKQVERFFARITTQRIRRGTVDSVRALETAIERYVVHNQQCRPFVWTATADAILD